MHHRPTDTSRLDYLHVAEDMDWIRSIVGSCVLLKRSLFSHVAVVVTITHYKNAADSLI